MDDTKSVMLCFETERRCPALGPFQDPRWPIRFDVFSEALGTTTPMTIEAETGPDAALRWVRHMLSRGIPVLSRLADGMVVTVVAGPSVFEFFVTAHDETVLTASLHKFEVAVAEPTLPDRVERKDGP